MRPAAPGFFSGVTWFVVCMFTANPSWVVHAETLEVGADRPLHQPSEAARAAKPGDVVNIYPGEYFDCATWSADDLTIEGIGPGVVITDKVCGGKALFIARGDNMVVRNITFTRARVPDENGAGIRAEGKNLTIEGSRFVNNEVGVLAGDLQGSQIKIVDSEFTDNGKCDVHCVGALMVGAIGVLQVFHSRFTGTKIGHHIQSSASRTELVDDQITDGPKGTSSYLVTVGGGGLLMKDCVLEKGPNTSNRKAAVFLAGGGGSATGGLYFTGNHFRNDGNDATAFVLNYMGDDVRFENNVLEGPVSQESSTGKWQDMASRLSETAKSQMRQFGGEVLHFGVAGVRKIGALRGE